MRSDIIFGTSSLGTAISSKLAAGFSATMQRIMKRLQRHYQNGPPPDWQLRYVSPYAAVHPWEDFAETWAHYLPSSILFGIEVKPAADRSGSLSTQITFAPYEIADFQQVVRAWLPFVFAMNSVSRAIGSRDLYPFILAPPVIEKLAFIHRLVPSARQSGQAGEKQAA